MSARCFVDSNVAIYPYDAREPTKAARAAAVLRTVAASGSGVVSTQVLGEVYVNLARFERAGALTRPSKAVVEDLAAACEVVDVTLAIALEAMRIAEASGLHFYDAQVIAAAASAGCDCLITEDLPTGASIAGVRIVNPFGGDLSVAVESPS